MTVHISTAKYLDSGVVKWSERYLNPHRKNFVKILSSISCHFDYLPDFIFLVVRSAFDFDVWK